MPAQRTIGLEELQQYFGLPEKEVAKRLGICLTSLKKVCRGNGILRWPYRKMKSLEKKNLQTGGFRSVTAASSPDDFRFVECSSPFSEISHASTAACSPSRYAACSSSPCSPSPEPECCPVYSSRTPALVHQRTESAQHLPKIKIECFLTNTTLDSHLIELDWSAAPRSSSPPLRDMEWTPATVPAVNHPGGKGLWKDILPEANAVSCEPSGGTDVSSDSNAAGMLSMSDEELIASLAGCAAPAAQHTPHEEPHLSKSTSSRAEVPAEQSIILQVDDEAAAPDSQTCCDFLLLEGCANDALRQPEGLVCDSHDSLWSQDSDLLGLC